MLELNCVDPETGTGLGPPNICLIISKNSCRKSLSDISIAEDTKTAFPERNLGL